MTPAARIQTAIEILDRILAGAAAEQVLTQWARASRFAGSGDRAAVRDHVFDALRRLRSMTAVGGGAAPSGRAVMLGVVKTAGADPASVFAGAGHGPMPLSDAECAALGAAPALQDLAAPVALDFPDWLETPLRLSLGPNLEAVMKAFQCRAPTFLRVHARRAERAVVRADLAREGIVTLPADSSRHALVVVENERKISRSAAYCSGLIELQDISPQTAVEELPLRPGMRVLDYCAGGGGKSLAMAARVDADYAAHDIAPARMRDLAVRARRARAAIRQVAAPALKAEAPFDLVLADVPCSGSGTWRRQPQAKWTLTAEQLTELCRMQAAILDAAAGHVGMGGDLVYMTCSLLRCENEDQIQAFLRRHPHWLLVRETRFGPATGGDGFFSALLTRRQEGR
ncbi:MAG: RsmB/NOP family class I SAM-dependent RNA methyltransferase [Rhodobacteraceae bacterium]|nr:RsmB/NOP family class I SAM-dependent RNA methyltransferase [Paracoccaceae bacterium]MCP5340814.1 RsmB/NOP family class I SAM-dependent RNA methyltransferase [Paracoccaceae bacterium]